MNRICTATAVLAGMAMAAPSLGEDIDLKTGLYRGRQVLKVKDAFYDRHAYVT